METIPDYNMELGSSFTLLFGSLIITKAQNEVIIRLLTEQKAKQEGRTLEEVTKVVDEMLKEEQSEQMRIHEKQIALLGKAV
ncbi:hypothetical protein [Hymenobacter glacialis]|nr:hypothetical protein [Hymenobacter glacialis]